MPNLNLPANIQISPWTVAVATLLVLVLIFFLTPDLAAQAHTTVDSLKQWFYNAAKGVLGGIKNQWKLIGQEEQRNKTKASRQLKREIDDRKNATPPLPALKAEDEQKRLQQLEKLYSSSGPLGGGVIAQAWARRFFYLILVLVCVFSDYVLVSTRAPILFGGGKTPDFLVTLFSYLQVITGALFVSVAGLSGMLIEEYTHESLPDVVKIDPDIPLWFKRTKLIIAAVMFILDIAVVIILTLLGVAKQYNESTYDVEYYAVFIGASLLIAIGIFLAWSGLMQALTGLGWLVFGSALALICAVVGLLLFLLAVILKALAALNFAIFGGARAGNDPKPRIDKRTLAIVGYGEYGGSDFAVSVCEQVNALYTNFAWLAGYYTPANDAALRGRLTRSKVTEKTIIVDPGSVSQSAVTPENVDQSKINGARALTEKLKGYYGPKPDIAKPLLWIVQDDDLGPSLEALKEFEQAPLIHNVELMIVWIVQGSPNSRRAALAQNLDTWTQELNKRAIQTGTSVAPGQNGAASVSSNGTSVAPGQNSEMPASGNGTNTTATNTTDEEVRAPGLLVTTLVIERVSPLDKKVGAAMDSVLARSVASLVVPDSLTERASFASELAQLRNGGSRFLSLAAGAIGINTASEAFAQGTIKGQGGQINPIDASATLRELADRALKDNAFETVTDKPLVRPGKATTGAPATTTSDAATSHAMADWERQQERVFVHLVAPTRLRLLKDYKGLVSEWLRRSYGVSQDHVSATRLWKQADKGVDIHTAIPEWRGEFYLHFTALRGVGVGGNEMPKDLQTPDVRESARP